MKKNNIIIAHLVLRFDIGGLEKVLIDTINRLDDSYEHIIISLTEASTESRKMLLRNVKIIELNKREGNDPSLWLKLFRILRRIRPNVLQTYNLPTIEYQFIGFIARVPHRIHAEHGRHADDPNGLNKKYLVLRKILRPFIHSWVPISEDLQRWLIDKVCIAPSKIRLIRNGIDTSWYSPQPDAGCNRLTNRLEGFAANDDFVVGTIGRLDPVKNQKILVESIDILRQREPEKSENILLAIVGSGPLEHELSALIESKDLGSRIWLPGARYDVVKILNEFDLFILPSLAEGIPLTLLEAMSMEVPVIASSVGGIPEVVDGSCGTLVAVNDAEAIVAALLQYSSERDRRKLHARNGRVRIEQKFSQTKMIESYESLYRLRDKY